MYLGFLKNNFTITDDQNKILPLFSVFFYSMVVFHPLGSLLILHVVWDKIVNIFVKYQVILGFLKDVFQLTVLCFQKDGISQMSVFQSYLLDIFTILAIFIYLSEHDSFVEKLSIFIFLFLPSYFMGHIFLTGFFIFLWLPSAQSRPHKIKFHFNYLINEKLRNIMSRRLT